MKFIGALALTLTLTASSVSAATLTPCTGSWDGPGLTACELLGAPGEVAGAAGLFFTPQSFVPVWEITAYDATNTLTVTPTGTLRYQPRAEVTEVFFSDDPVSQIQFAVWRKDDEVWVGIEDLIDGDFDYNDYIVRVQTVPEAPLGLLLSGGLGLLATARATRRALFRRP